MSEHERSPNQSTYAKGYRTCASDEIRKKRRSLELQELVTSDQKDREDFMTKTAAELMEMASRDEVRRKRVGEIFGEGCLTSVKDYAAAALVFQHGDLPDHYYQTFIWSKRAVDLGDSTQKSLIALSIDRYLVSVGRQQLLGSQASQADRGEVDCYCMQPIERTFPDKLRRQYTGKSLAEAYRWLDSLNVGKSCQSRDCKVPLKRSLKGSVPGLW